MLAPGTPISTPIGFSPIARLRAGDTVLSLGGNLSRPCHGLVIRASEQLQEKLLKVPVGTSLVYCTPELRMRTQVDGWVEIGELTVGTTVLCVGIDGSFRWIAAGKPSEVVTGRDTAPWKVWGLDIEAAQPYVANGVVVL